MFQSLLPRTFVYDLKWIPILNVVSYGKLPHRPLTRVFDHSTSNVVDFVHVRNCFLDKKCNSITWDMFEIGFSPLAVAIHS